MYGAELDNLEGLDLINNKFLDIDVLNPRTHIRNGKALYTDYEIHVKTNHPEFALKESRVRRRYSEFSWLKQRLGFNDVMMVTAPSLPGKRYIGKFKEPFLKKRQSGLQNFLNKVIEINAFLSEPALHLFLQSSIPTSEMEYHLLHASHLSNVRDVILQSNNARQRKEQKQLKKIGKGGKLKRSLSLDSLHTSSKELRRKQEKEGGPGTRGWSRYIGEGYHSWTYITDSVDYGGSPGSFRPRSITMTACVLPGGRLKLAGGVLRKPSPLAIETESERNRRQRWKRQRPLSASWHGKTRDVIDIVLDDYDVITNDSIPTSDVESSATSQPEQEQEQESFSSYSYDESSDDGIEIDIAERLKEYNIIEDLIPQQTWMSPRF